MPCTTLPAPMKISRDTRWRKPGFKKLIGKEMSSRAIMDTRCATTNKGRFKGQSMPLIKRSLSLKTKPQRRQRSQWPKIWPENCGISLRNSKQRSRKNSELGSFRGKTSNIGTSGRCAIEWAEILKNPNKTMLILLQHSESMKENLFRKTFLVWLWCLWRKIEKSWSNWLISLRISLIGSQTLK